MHEIAKPAITKRSLNILIMIIAFILLPISGMMLGSSHGRPETDPVRHLGQTLHHLAAIVFMVTAVIHALANRKALGRIIAKK
jgi:hypothetical protein